MIEIRPYKWEGPYAQMRSSNGWDHDAGLCATVRAPWMTEGEHLILRSSEIVAYETGYLYDDHFPPCEPEGRGRDYAHISFQWDARQAPKQLAADCVAKGRGAFSLVLRAETDHVDIELGIRNDRLEPMGRIDWHFCVVGFDCPTIADPDLERTYLFDGSKLRSLGELSGEPRRVLFSVAGGDGYIAAIHAGMPRGSVEANTSLVIVESIDGAHSAALGFDRSCVIFSNPTNRCFHADPCFEPLRAKGDHRSARGRLYLIKGPAEEAFKRYRSDFGTSCSRGR